MLSEDIAKIFRICGYILLYILAGVIAGAIGGLTAHIAERFILEKFFKHRIKPYRDWIEVSRPICILTCVTGFLIVAVGLLFMHLIGLLPPEYDEVAVQVAIAFFGLVVFVCMSLILALMIFSLLWLVLWYKERRDGVRSLDEETGLLKHSRKSYCSINVPAEDDGQDHVEVVGRQRHAAPVRRLSAAPTVELQKPKQGWIKMMRLSSVRNLDFSRMRDRLSDVAVRDSFAIH